MLRNMFESLFKDLSFDDDGNFDWILHKQLVIEKRAQAEEAERKHKQQQALLMGNSRGAKKNVAKMQLIEEEERKKQDAEVRKAKAEEDKRAALSKDYEKKGQLT